MTTFIPPDNDIEYANFWEHYLHEILQMTYWLRVPEQDVKDVVQVVAQKSKKKWHTRRERTWEATRAWVHRILRNTVADYFRKRIREQAQQMHFATVEEQEALLEGIESPQPYFNPSEWLQHQERANLFWQAILSLKQPDYFLVLHYYYYELNVADIAVAMNLPYETVKKRLQRVIDKLWKILQKAGYKLDDL